MKGFLLFNLLVALVPGACHNQLNHTMDNQNNGNFQAERITKTATIVLNGPIDTVFPLFGAFEEKKWAEGWNPVPLFPLSETMAEGILFKTAGHIHYETENIWVVSKYQPADHLVQYTVIAPGRFQTITITCAAATAGTPGSATRATITYTFTGLNETGNTISKHLITKMYAMNLKDWEEAINKYLTR
ncbi:SRPBCC family protein [Flavitalea flava]